MQKIKIYVNTLPVTQKSGGIKTFLLELLDALAAIKDEEFEYDIICSEITKPIFIKYEAFENFKLITVNTDNRSPLKRILFEQFKLNVILKNQTNAILLNICNVAVVKCAAPQVTIIQAPLSIPSLRKTLPKEYISLSRLHKVYYDLLVIKSISISEKTIAVSKFMKQFLGSNQQKIEVIYEGVDINEFTEDKTLSKQINEPYILAVNTLFPYKNVDKLIKAFGIFKKKGFPHKLIIAGRDPDQNQLALLKQLAKDENIELHIDFIGLVPHDKIAELYQKASLFMLLSSVETFGLPVLEAMSSGVPVIASNKMSIPEVVGDAGILVDPLDIQSIAAQIELVLTNDELRNDLIAKGKQNVQLFSWNTTAANFRKVFAEIAQKIFRNR